MSKSRAWCAVMVALAPVIGAGAVMAANPAEIAAQRQEILNSMLTDEYQPALIAGLRRLCASGGAPASVARDRRDGTSFTPDAADECVAALVRTARDGHLTDLYRQFPVDLGGSGDGYEKLPRAIAAAVLGGSGKVAIGNSKAAVVTPSLALDAGFTVAYQDGTASKPPSADARQLRTIAESCLSEQEDAGTCFSAGYAYGANAFKARTASAR